MRSLCATRPARTNPSTAEHSINSFEAADQSCRAFKTAVRLLKAAPKCDPRRGHVSPVPENRRPEGKQAWIISASIKK
jgi:hypothetical protein